MSARDCVQFNLGDTIKLSRDKIGVIKYIGFIENKHGEWYGIELMNRMNGGKNNGCVDGIFYFQTSDGHKNGLFVRRHQILYLVKRNVQKKKRNKKIKLTKRNYIKRIKSKMIKTKQSLVMNIPFDLLKYKLRKYFYSFEQFKLRRVCCQFNEIFNDTANILSSSIHSDFEYWTNHSLTKYYKVSYYFIHLDLRQNRLSYLSKEERIALKYFVIFHQNMMDKKDKEMGAIKNKSMIEMTRTSFCNSSSDQIEENIDWICDILQFCPSAKCDLSCLKVLDFNFIGLNDECLFMLCNGLLRRKSALNDLQYLLLMNNANVTDKYMDVLFEAIEQRCPSLRHLNLRRCNLGNLSCSIIFNFYLRHSSVGTSIKHIDLELNTKITKHGRDKIGKIFEINKNKKNDLIIHHSGNKKSHCWECRTLYNQ